MNVTYRKFQMSDQSVIVDMMQALCHEDPTDHFSSTDRVKRTLTELNNNPAKGTVYLIEVAGQTVGYCLVVFYWSNEFGGNILLIDEFYVKADWRGKGLGTGFLHYLIKKRFHYCVAMELETMPNNHRARRLYERVGFKLSDRKYYVYDFHPEE
jgi:GNAT superfamily N-acetyltransferase